MIGSTAPWVTSLHEYKSGHKCYRNLACLKGDCVLLQKLGVVELPLLLASSDGNFTKRSHFLSSMNGRVIMPHDLHRFGSPYILPCAL